MQICELASSGKISGSGKDQKKCYEWLVTGEPTQFLANGLAILATPNPPVISQGVVLNARQLTESCPVGNSGDCWRIKVCLMSKENAGYLCQPEDFELSLSVTTEDQLVLVSRNTLCYQIDGSGQNIEEFENGPGFLNNFDGTSGCMIPLDVTEKCLRVCYEPGFINNAWYRAAKQMIGKPNLVGLLGCEPCEALLTSINGSASLVDPFIFEFCWKVICNTEVSYPIGRPKTACVDGVCQVTELPPVGTIFKPGWSKIRVNRDNYTPCYGEDCESPGRQKFIRQVYLDDLIEKFDHTILFPPGFTDF